MVDIQTVYEGGLRCRVTHGPSGQTFQTDAPTDNQGKGEAISPTDLLAASLGACILTVMGILAQRRGIELVGTTIRVQKEMSDVPVRRVVRLASTVTFPRRFSDDERALLERTATSCPVHHSLHPDIALPIEFIYPS